ncbi:hypothetical protein B0H10DRAFT_2320492 [Mycena sp. CBHHK59/15]|nr:hypothetical protein B0H10DRAFT_1961204 [Mycena sp. CBHHK59/15]KAJ6600209.1 hypothetical protein B0H10DRAFT_2320492 [Mycena sp. CBHHK59/15]
MDPTIRKALIIHNNNTAHNHPMPALTKASFELKAAYRKCIEAAGCVRATVSKVDNVLNFIHALVLLRLQLKMPDTSSKCQILARFQLKMPDSSLRYLKTPHFSHILV